MVPNKLYFQAFCVGATQPSVGHGTPTLSLPTPFLLSLPAYIPKNKFNYNFKENTLLISLNFADPLPSPLLSPPCTTKSLTTLWNVNPS